MSKMLGKDFMVLRQSVWHCVNFTEGVVDLGQTDFLRG